MCSLVLGVDGHQLFGWMVKTIVNDIPAPIILPLNDTLEALPVQVFALELPDQPVPDTLFPAITTILVKLPSVVVNVPVLLPEFMKFLFMKSID